MKFKKIAVISFALILLTASLALSHISSPNILVPEPATMLLLGCGLIGVAGFSRKKLKKS